MNKEEILAKSREENKNIDLFETEVAKHAVEIAAYCTLTLATIFYFIQLFFGLGVNYGLISLGFLAAGINALYKGLKLKKTRRIVLAVWCFLIVATSAVVYIITLSKEAGFIS